MIFEILNAKGKKLSAIDLIKNKIFENVGSTVDEEAEVQWKKIQQKLSERDIPMLVFFRHFWASKYKKTSANNLYNGVNVVISKGNKEVKKKRTIELLKELNENVAPYIYIDSPNDLSFWDNKKAYQEIVDTLFFIKTFNTTLYRIAVLALIRAKQEEKINMKWFKKSILCIEEFSFVFFQIFSSRGSKVEDLFSKFAIELTSCEKNNAISVINIKLLDELKKIMPSYEEFKGRFMDLKYTNSLKKNSTDYTSVRYVINKINIYYSDNSKIVDKSCSIEHIIPDDKINNITWNIGNLIPLEEVINNRLGEAKYDEKKEGYLESDYKEVREFVKLNSTWEENQIEKRAEEIANLYYNKIMQIEIREVKK